MYEQLVICKENLTSDDVDATDFGGGKKSRGRQTTRAVLGSHMDNETVHTTDGEEEGEVSSMMEMEMKTKAKMNGEDECQDRVHVVN